MAWSRWRARLNFWKLAAVLALLTAVIALGISVVIESFYQHDPSLYEPKDMPREKQIERNEAAQQSQSTKD